MFTQTYTWSDLGELKTIGYPDLAGYTEPAGAISTLTYGYTNGFLTGVTGYATSITYHPNGALDTITRANTGTDVFGLDPDGMPRTRWLRSKKGICARSDDPDDLVTGLVPTSTSPGPQSGRYHS